jgi:hypothetical protein
VIRRDARSSATRQVRSVEDLAKRLGAGAHTGQYALRSVTDAKVFAMSYELVFWQRDAGHAANANGVYQSLMDGSKVDGLRTLPIEDIVAAILTAFPRAVREPNGPTSEWIDWVREDEQSSFQVEWSPQHVGIDLRPKDNDIANRLIDIMVDDFRCPLYDPQTGERFDSTMDT